MNKLYTNGGDAQTKDQLSSAEAALVWVASLGQTGRPPHPPNPRPLKRRSLVSEATDSPTPSAPRLGFVFMARVPSPLPDSLGRRNANPRVSFSAYAIDIPSLDASLHRCPTDHIGTAYKRRPEQSNPAGRAICHRHSSCSSRGIRDGGDRNTNPQLLEPRYRLRLRR